MISLLIVHGMISLHHLFVDKSEDLFNNKQLNYRMSSCMLELLANELLSSSKYDCFLEYGKTRHHLKTIRSDTPIKDETFVIENHPETQFNSSIIEITNIRTQHYPRGRITDFTDLRPTRPTYVADIMLYTRRPLVCVPKSLDKRFQRQK